MSPEVLGHVPSWLRAAALAAFFGSFVFFWQWEGGRRPPAGPVHSLRHAARNVAVFVLAVAVVLAVFGGNLTEAFTPSARDWSGLLAPLDLPLAAQVLIAIVVVDLGSYLLHRLCHAFRPLWLLHAVHHSDPEVDVTTAMRFHPLEPALNAALALGLIVALGLPPWIQLARAVIVNPWNFFQHADIALPQRVEQWLARWFVTPAMHRLHHSPDRAETDSNYGQLFVVWDRWLGTYRSPGATPHRRCGLDALTAESWQTVRGMLATPLRARRLERF